MFEPVTIREIEKRNLDAFAVLQRIWRELRAAYYSRPPHMTHQAEISTDLEERLIALESRIAFQDLTIEELNEVVTRQQDQIDTLTKKVSEMRDQVAAPGLPQKEGYEEIPPHY